MRKQTSNKKIPPLNSLKVQIRDFVSAKYKCNAKIIFKLDLHIRQRNIIIL